MYRTTEIGALSYTFSHLIKGPPIDPMQFIEKDTTKKQQYNDQDGKPIEIWKYTFDHE